MLLADQSGGIYSLDLTAICSHKRIEPLTLPVGRMVERAVW